MPNLACKSLTTDVALFADKSQLSIKQLVEIGTLSVCPSTKISNSLWSLTTLETFSKTTSALGLITALPDWKSILSEIEIYTTPFFTSTVTSSSLISAKERFKVMTKAKFKESFC